MKMNPTKLIGFLAIMASLQGQAQIRVPVTNNDLRNSLQKVISDFPNQFSTLKGDTVT